MFWCLSGIFIFLTFRSRFSNKILKTFYANNNPNLTCISVDNPVLSLTYPDWKKDVTATYSDNCIPSGIDPTKLNKSIVINPNPSSGIFKIEGLPTNQKNRISVYTNGGKLIKKKVTNSTTETIDIGDQASGIYLLDVNKQIFKILKK